jgi:hypothetical protein
MNVPGFVPLGFCGVDAVRKHWCVSLEPHPPERNGAAATFKE